jgi:hypothetical protein
MREAGRFVDWEAALAMFHNMCGIDRAIRSQ